MITIRIWAVESDYDKEAVGKLAQKLVNHLGRKDITIQTAGRKAYTTVAKRLRRNPKALQIAVSSYLKKEDHLIFVLDSDSAASLQDRRRHTYSAITQIEKLMKQKAFAGRVHLAIARQEIEAWLLVDCLGVACYFLKTLYAKNCRERLVRRKQLNQVVRKYQKGKTELIVESTASGRGPKEYIIQFSKAILQKSNPNMKPRNLTRSQYREALAPEIVPYLEINRQTLGRNSSLKAFCDLLASFEKR